MMASASAPLARRPSAAARTAAAIDGCADGAVGERALVDLEAQVAVGDRHELAPQAPGLAAIAPAHLQHVAEAARGDDADARPAPLQQRIGADRGAVDDRAEVRDLAERVEPLHEAGRLVAALRRHLGGAESCARPASNRNRSVKVPPTSTPTIGLAALMPAPRCAARRWPPRRRAVVIDRHAVIAPRRLARDVAEPHIARDARRLARQRIAETAAARRLQPHALAAPDTHVGDLGDQRRRALARIGVEEEAVERRRLAAVDAERRILAALAEQEHVGVALVERLDLVDRAEPAAMAAGTGGIRPQRPLREHHRIKRLQDFRRRNGGGRDRIVAVVEAVAFRIAAEPAAEEAEHHPALRRSAASRRARAR